MNQPVRAALLVLLLSALAAARVSSVRMVSLLQGTQDTELEIATDDLITPNVQVITGPDRLVIDFPNATPASTLRNLTIGSGEVNGVRVALFSAAPPVTRVVVDLKMPQSYQVFPGADIAIPSGAEQEQVVANYGPGPAEQVIAALLNGSRFNFVTIGDPAHPARLANVILMPRTGGIPQNPAPAPQRQQTAQTAPQTAGDRRLSHGAPRAKLALSELGCHVDRDHGISRGRRHA